MALSHVNSQDTVTVKGLETVGLSALDLVAIMEAPIVELETKETIEFAVAVWFLARQLRSSVVRPHVGGQVGDGCVTLGAPFNCTVFLLPNSSYFTLFYFFLFTAVFLTLFTILCHTRGHTLSLPAR